MRLAAPILWPLAALVLGLLALPAAARVRRLAGSGRRVRALIEAARCAAALAAAIAGLLYATGRLA